MEGPETVELGMGAYGVKKDKDGQGVLFFFSFSSSSAAAASPFSLLEVVMVMVMDGGWSVGERRKEPLCTGGFFFSLVLERCVNKQGQSRSLQGKP